MMINPVTNQKIEINHGGDFYKVMEDVKKEVYAGIEHEIEVLERFEATIINDFSIMPIFFKK